jgi:hypothetical protein
MEGKTVEILPDIKKDIEREMDRQLSKWGIQDHGHYYWFGILAEEVGEVSKAMIENAVHSFAPKPCSYFGLENMKENLAHLVIQRKDNTDIRRELIQVAAVAIAWMECMERRATPPGHYQPA